MEIMEIKTITIKLPADHPIFEVPRGRRSEIIRRWLEAGINLSQIESKLDRILEKMDEVKQLPFISAEVSAEDNKADDATGTNDGLPKNFNLESFMESIDEIFRGKESKSNSEP